MREVARSDYIYVYIYIYIYIYVLVVGLVGAATNLEQLAVAPEALHLPEEEGGSEGSSHYINLHR